jgi:hypothetical protein
LANRHGFSRTAAVLGLAYNSLKKRAQAAASASQLPSNGPAFVELPGPIKANKAREKERGEGFLVEVLGPAVTATNTGHGIRAVCGWNPIAPESVRGNLEKSSGQI